MHLMASRPAKVGDKLVAADSFNLFGRSRVIATVAPFRQVNMDDPLMHHDALGFPGGQIVMVTRLIPGQQATVLELPVGKPVRDRQDRGTRARRQAIEN